MNMKTMNTAEMKATNGGLWWVVGLIGGAALGINIRIGYEHARYGRCYTYKRWCKRCKNR